MLIQINAEIETEDKDLTYNDLFAKFPEESNASIGTAYDAIEQLLSEAETYFQVNLVFNHIRTKVLFSQGWLKYQVLWDLEPNDVFQRLGTNIQSWFECLKDIKYVFDRASNGPDHNSNEMFHESIDQPLHS